MNKTLGRLSFMLLGSYATVYYISGLALPSAVAFTTLICDEKLRDMVLP